MISLLQYRRPPKIGDVIELENHKYTVTEVYRHGPGYVKKLNDSMNTTLRINNLKFCKLISSHD